MNRSGSGVAVVLPAQAGVVLKARIVALRIPVLPAQAGVVHWAAKEIAEAEGAPRSGGGGPSECEEDADDQLCSPLRRGWSWAPGPADPMPVVLPAQAGVVPAVAPATSGAIGAPRSGGGGPFNEDLSKEIA